MLKLSNINEKNNIDSKKLKSNKINKTKKNSNNIKIQTDIIKNILALKNDIFKIYRLFRKNKFLEINKINITELSNSHNNLESILMKNIDILNYQQDIGKKFILYATNFINISNELINSINNSKIKEDIYIKANIKTIKSKDLYNQRLQLHELAKTTLPKSKALCISSLIVNEYKNKYDLDNNNLIICKTNAINSINLLRKQIIIANDNCQTQIIRMMKRL
tara:strand:- start:1899 stop:2561 length:663 start_codon:yes stop_codon:yes gene_type:complete